jgi:putative transposase
VEAVYSTVVSSFKRLVTASMRNRGYVEKRSVIWQDRFWEHTIRDDDDYLRSIEYIHYNPVKHGLTKTPIEWEYSSVHQYIKDGYYGTDWTDWVDVQIDGAEYD